MALSNQQYESIMRRYEQTRDANRHIMEERRETVLHRIPEYGELEASVGSVSLAKAQCLLNGDDTALPSLHAFLDEIRQKKQELLTAAGFPADFLEPVYTCADCKDTGYLDGEYPQKEKCHCLRQQEISILYEQSNIQATIARENFSALSYEYYQGEDLERFQGAVKICKDFVRDFGQDYRNLFFYGTVGTGKSFLSGCVAGELLKQGYSVIYFSSAALFDTLARYTFDTKMKETLYNFYEDLYNCELVIIDDLGTEVTNSFVASQLFSCLNERHLRQRATVISTNLGLEELRDRYSDRIFSRITSNYTLCKLTGSDIRMRRKLSNLHMTE
ncbi:MAG: ATP-binding protein [Acetatifactor sp.]|nr:ATP-binding protein [Acetatifactor sp.]